ncbi:MAG: hypothetical protein AB7J28_16710 [Hyphomonadaceae bacterium]
MRAIISPPISATGFDAPNVFGRQDASEGRSRVAEERAARH